MDVVSDSLLVPGGFEVVFGFVVVMGSQ